MDRNSSEDREEELKWLDKLSRAYIWDSILFSEQFWNVNGFSCSKLESVITDINMSCYTRQEVFRVEKGDMQFFYAEQIRLPEGHMSMYLVEPIPSFDFKAIDREIHIM